MRNTNYLKKNRKDGTQKMLVKTDGNGGITINKALLGLLTFILLVVTTIVSLVAFSAGISSDLKHTQEKVNNCDDKIQLAISRLDEAEKSISSVDADMDNIKENLKEIRSDIKLLLQKTGG